MLVDGICFIAVIISCILWSYRLPISNETLPDGLIAECSLKWPLDKPAV